MFRHPPVSAAWEAEMGPSDFQLVARTVDELGVTWVSVTPARSLEEHLDGLRCLAAEVLAVFRSNGTRR